MTLLLLTRRHRDVTTVQSLIFHVFASVKNDPRRPVVDQDVVIAVSAGL